jgi:hypothetical protein
LRRAPQAHRVDVRHERVEHRRLSAHLRVAARQVMRRLHALHGLTLLPGKRGDALERRAVFLVIGEVQRCHQQVVGDLEVATRRRCGV